MLVRFSLWQLNASAWGCTFELNFNERPSNPEVIHNIVPPREESFTAYFSNFSQATTDQHKASRIQRAAMLNTCQ